MLFKLCYRVHSHYSTGVPHRLTAGRLDPVNRLLHHPLHDQLGPERENLPSVARAKEESGGRRWVMFNSDHVAFKNYFIIKILSKMTWKWKWERHLCSAVIDCQFTFCSVCFSISFTTCMQLFVYSVGEWHVIVQGRSPCLTFVSVFASAYHCVNYDAEIRCKE